MKKFVLILYLYFSGIIFGQISLDKFNQEFPKKPQPILLYFYTDWCAYCKIQEREIENNLSLKNELNDGLYFLKINGESIFELDFLGNKFPPNNKSKTHDFVKQFLNKNEQENYPFWIILNENLQIIDKNFGFLTKKQLSEIINKIKNGN